MSYTYANRRRVCEDAPHKATAAQQPSTEALRSGAAKPTAEQMGHRVDLPDAMRAKMENAFGADLSSVKLYESEAVGVAGAEAITQGANIAFAPGMLDFSSFGGQALLGHELSHVVSQARGEVAGGGFLNDRALESRADREGAMAAAGQQIAAPTAAMSSVSAAPAAGPMQAKKSKKDAAAQQQAAQNPHADMIAAMKEQGFTDDQIQAQLMFQGLNDSAGPVSAGQQETVDETVKSLVSENESVLSDKAEMEKALAAQKAVEASTETGFLAGQRRIGAHHNVTESASRYRKGLYSRGHWGYRKERETDAAQGISSGIIDESARKRKQALDAETVKLKSENFSGEMHGGALNQVYKFNEGKAASEKGGYFKPKTDDYSGTSLEIMKDIGIKGADSGKVADYDPHLTDREIAFSVLGKMLGSSVALESRQASVQDSDLTGKKYGEREYMVGKGDSGVMMEEAQGDSWDQYNWDFYGYDPYTDKVRSSGERYRLMKQLGAAPSKDGAALSRKAFSKPKAGSPLLPTAQALLSDKEQAGLPKEQSIIEAMTKGENTEKGKTVGERVAAAVPDAKMKKKSTRDFGKLERSFDQGYYQKETIDAANPDFQREMNELFLLDTLAGHLDRHGDNFKVSQTDDGKGGKKVGVKAIDNDLTFGEDASKFGKWGRFYSGLPEQMQIDAKMAKNIRGMTKEALETTLGHLLKKEEIDALWEKFQMMNEYIGEMEKKNLLVDEWNDETSKRELQMAEGLGAYHIAEDGKRKHSGNTYYQRMLLTLELASKGQGTYKTDF